MTESTEKHFKPGDQVIVRKVELPEEKQYLRWPLGDREAVVGEFVTTRANTQHGYRIHTILVPPSNVDGDWFEVNFWDEEVELFEPEKFDTEGVTAAKNIAYDALTNELDKTPDLETQGLDVIELAELVIEALKAAGVEFPDSIVDPHALSGAWSKIANNYAKGSA